MNESAPGSETTDVSFSDTRSGTHPRQPPPPTSLYCIQPPIAALGANLPAETREGSYTLSQTSSFPHVSDEVTALWSLMQTDTSRLTGVFARVLDFIALWGLRVCYFCTTFECKSAKRCDVAAASVLSGEEGLTGVQPPSKMFTQCGLVSTCELCEKLI